MEIYKGMTNGAAPSVVDASDAEFGKRLKEVFEKHGVSQRSVCDRLHISKTLMYRWTNGSKTMKLKRFAKIADGISFTTSEIVYLLEPYWEDEDDE